MKISHFRKTVLAIGIAGVCVGLATTCQGVGGIVYDPTNWLENSATNITTAKMLLKETQMLDLQLKSMKHLGTFNYQEIANVIQKLEDITKRGQGLSYAMSDVDKQFSKHYPNYNGNGKLPVYKQAYTTWDETSLQTFQNTLQAIGVASQDTKNQRTLLEKLKTQSSTEEGQTRLLQIGHALAINTNQHLMALQEIMSAQTNSQTAYMSHKISKETYEKATMSKIMANALEDAPTDEGESYGKIEFHAGHPH